MAGEGGLLGGYGGCGCPGQGLGCAESLPGVPRLYEYQRFLQDMKTFIVYQKVYKLLDLHYLGLASVVQVHCLGA